MNERLNHLQQRPSQWRDDVSRVLVAIFVTGIVPLLSKPFPALPFNDDFAYARMAFSVARTGTFKHEGWVSPMTGPMAYWGAAFVRMFGESYDSLRISTLVMSALTAGLIYILARLCDLSGRNALLASLVSMLSPVMIPLSVSFMSDVPALFFAMLALVCGAWSLRTHNQSDGTVLFVLMLLAGFLGGLVRQFVWAIVLFIPPVAMLGPARSALARVSIAFAWIAGLAGIVAVNRYVAAQPYAVSEHIGEIILGALFRPTSVLKQGHRLVHATVCAAFPALVGLLPILLLTPRKKIVLPIACIVSIASASVLLGQFSGKAYRFLLEPPFGSMVSAAGTMANTSLAGTTPQVLPEFATHIVRGIGLCIMALLAWGGWIALRRHVNRSWFRSIRQDGLRQTPMLYVTVFALGSFALIWLRSSAIVAFDRYVILFLPVVVIATIRLREIYIGEKSSQSGWALMAVFAVVGVVFTHDYAETSRAVSRAVEALQRAGVPRYEMSASFESDCAFHLSEWGYANNSRIVNPPDAVFRIEVNPNWRAYRGWNWTYVPSIYPRFVVSQNALEGYRATGFPQVEYTCLFPPCRRSLVIQEVVDATQRPFITTTPTHDPPGRNAAPAGPSSH